MQHHHNFLRRTRLTPLASAIALALCGVASAQTTAKVDADRSKSVATPVTKPATLAPEVARIESVVVSANKRIEKLENVPMAISVLDEAALERNNIREMGDIIELTPALTVNYGSTPANNGINMRGIGTTSIGIGVEADVAVIIDDIPIGMQVKAFQDLADLARVEVLKGPQSTMFGKSAVAGAINIVTKPISGPQRGKASSMYTSDGEWRVGASYGGEVNDKFAYRLAVSNTDFPGNMHNLTTGKDVNGSGGKTFMAKLVWRPTEALDIEFSPRYNYSKTSCCVIALRSMEPARGGLLYNIAQLPAETLLSGIQIGEDNVTVRNDVATGQTSSDRGAGLKLNYSLPSGSILSAIASVDRYFADDIRDQDFVDVPTLKYLPLANGKPANVDQGNIYYGTFEVDARTAELRLVSPDRGALRYVAGLWYGKNTIDRHFVRGYSGIATTSPVRYYTDTYNINSAVFGQLSWDFSPSYSLTAGLRWNREVSGYSFTKGLPPPAAFVPTAHYGSEGNGENAVTGKLSLQHQFNPELMGYATIASGYKGKGYDLTSGLNAATAALLPVKSETSKTMELGLKSNFLNHRATLGAALFYSRFDDFQQNSGSYLPGTTVFVTRLNSIPYVQTKGIEFDLVAAPFARLPGLTMTGALALTRATIGSFPNGPCYNVADTSNGGYNAACQRNSVVYGGSVQDLSGAGMPSAPKTKVNLGVQYETRFAGSAHKFFVHGTLRYQSEMNTALSQNPELVIPGYSIFNLGFGAKSASGKYKLSFFVNNLFDQHYARGGLSGGGAWSSKAPNPALRVTAHTWTPARDAFRYYGLRFDVQL